MSLLETGELSKPIFNATGDTYTDKRPTQRGTIKGVRQFVTSTPKSGLGGTWGERYRPVARLYEGEVYEPSSKMVARQQAANRAKFLVPTGFVPSNPAKKPTGPGHTDGTFSPCLPLGPTAMPAKGEVPKKPEPAPKNFITSTPKKGGAGVPGTTLSPFPAPLPEPYDSLREQRKREARAERARMADKKPFVSACQAAGRATIDAREHSSTGVSSVYAEDDRALPRRKLSTDGLNPKQRAERKAAQQRVEKPFVPSAPPKGGFNSTLSPFPERQPEPWDPAATRMALLPTRRLPDKRRTAGLKGSVAERPVMKPSSGAKTGVTRSVAKMYISKSTLSLGRRR